MTVKQQPLELGWPMTVLGMGCTLFWTSLAEAQSLVPDMTLGLGSSTVRSEGQGDAARQLIEGGVARGPNLFHSFERFGVEAEQAVYFSNPSGIERMFSRVTGDQASQIDGTLGVLGPADLFLLNPNGILFGPGARLDLSGALTASTAAAFDFVTEQSFSAVTAGDEALLRMNVPFGLQLNTASTGAALGEITSLGRLEAGGDLALLGNRLYLEGEVRAGGDLTLKAEETVTIRDTVSDAFVARSQGDLTIQGNQGIDIWTLQHLDHMPFASGGDLSLISDGVISGDAHFQSGGNLKFLTLAGEPGRFTSFYDPIISADGDVVFGDYTGAALKVEATGSIEAGDIEITGPDLTLEADGSGSDEDWLASRRAVILRAGLDSVTGTTVPEMLGGATFADQPVDGQSLGGIVVNSINTSDLAGGDGGPIILEARGDITTTGSFENSFGIASTLDASSQNLLSGSGGAGRGGFITITSQSGNILIPGTVDTSSVSFLNPGDSGRGGNISMVSNVGNIVVNRLRTNSAASEGYAEKGGDISLSSGSGDITIWDFALSGSSVSNMGDASRGGAISISSDSGNISVGGLTSSSAALASGNAGEGGDITLFSRTGNIELNNFVESGSFTNPFDSPPVKNSSNGGLISISTQSGDISILDDLSSRSSAAGQAGNGGDIEILSESGSIRTYARIDASSNSSHGDAGNGGNILISSDTGNLMLGGQALLAHSLSRQGNAGNGGNISLRAREGVVEGGRLFFDINLITFSIAQQEGKMAGKGGAVVVESADISTLRIFSPSSSGESGDVILHNPNGDLAIENLLVIATGTIEVPDPDASFSGSQFIVLELSDFGQSGDTFVTSAGDITFNNVEIQSDANGSETAGGIFITAPGKVQLSNSQISSNANRDGDAGQIEVKAGQFILSNGGRLFAATSSTGDGGTIMVNATDSVLLGEGVQDFAPIISVEASGAGKPGDIEINSPNFVLSETARITATSTETATNLEQGGSIAIGANRMDLSGVVGVFAETESQSPGGQLRLTSYQSNPDLDITLAPGSRISASTSSRGAAGGISIVAPESISIRGKGIISAETSAAGQGGDIRFSTPKLTIADGTRISTTAKLPQPQIVEIEVIESEDLFHVIDVDLGGAIPESSDSNFAAFTFTVPEVGESITDVDLRFSAAHSWNSDLTVFLESPEIRIATLFNGVGGDGQNFQDTLLDDAATISIDDAAAPFAGTYSLGKFDPLALESDQLSVFNGGNAAGIWTLTVVDQFAGEDGTLFKAGDAAPWGSALGTQLLLRSQTILDRRTETVDLAPRPTLDNPNLGRGGMITVEANEVNLLGSRLLSETNGFARGGDIVLQPNGTHLGQQLVLNLAEDARISVATSGDGPGGSLRVNASGAIAINGLGTLSAETRGMGAGGNIEFDSQTLAIADNTRISAATTGAGAGGSLLLNAPQAITLSNNARLSAETSGAGPGGNIDISTSVLTLLDGSDISTTARLPQPQQIEQEVSENIDFFNIVDVDNSEVIAEFITPDVVQLTFTAPGLPGAIADLDVRFSAAHTYVSDLEVQLESPAGSLVTLFDGIGGDGDHFQDTLLDDAAPDSILDAEAPFAGVFNLGSETELSLFNGEAAAGIWTLTVTDHFMGDGGDVFQAGDDAPWGTALGTQLLLATQVPITRTETVTLPAGPTPIPTLENPDLGRGGSITVNANDINLTDSSILAETEGFTRGGDISLQAKTESSVGRSSGLNVNFEDNSRISVSTAGDGQSGSVQVAAPEALTIRGEGILSAETRGRGAGGNIELDSPVVAIADNARLSVSASGDGSGGRLQVTAPQSLSLSNNSRLSAETSGQGSGGQVQIQTQQFTVQGGSQLSTTTHGPAQGGAIDIDATNGVTLASQARLLAQSTNRASGTAGDINISTGELNIDQSNITVRSTGTGDGGNIRLSANRSMIIGNGSLIETDAGGSGNGGNIDIQTPFLIALPGRDSDIIANAIDGDGGQITITAQALLNIEQRDGQLREQVLGNRSNDISASSVRGLDGPITLNLPAVEPGNNLAELPTEVVDGNDLIERELCAAGNKSKFLVTGRGGVPASPTDTLSALPIWEGAGASTAQTPETPLAAAVEAQHWSTSADGNVVLYAAVPASMQMRSPSCQTLQEAIAPSH